MPPKLAFSFRVQEPRPARTQAIEGSVVKIGSSPTADLVVDDPLVAPLHAVLEAASPTEISLVDLGSEHGTFVRGSRVDRCALRPGDPFQVGATTLMLVSAEALFERTGSYRASPVAEVQAERRQAPKLSVTLTPEERALFKPRPSLGETALAAAGWLLGHSQWWPVPTAVLFASVYLAQHGLSLPPWSDLSAKGLTWDWPVPRMLLLSGLLGSLLGLGDALLRDGMDERTVAGRILLLLAGLVSVPVLVYVAAVAFAILMPLGTAVYMGWLVVSGLRSLGRWVLGRPDD